MKIGRGTFHFLPRVESAPTPTLAGRLALSKAIVGKTMRHRAVELRTGNAVILEYFNADFPRFVEEFSNFVQAITSRGAGDKIYRGEFPLKPAPIATPVSVVAPSADQSELKNKSR